MKKGMNALETIFLLFVLMIVVVITVQMFTKFTSIGQQKLGTSINNIEKVSGYQEAFQTCNTACSDYLSSRDIVDLVQYCTKSVSLDIDFNGVKDDYEPTVSDLNSGKPVLLNPIGYVVCENNVYCPQLTKCEQLDLGTCVNRLCRYYFNTYRKFSSDSEAATQATEMIKNLYKQGDCDIEGIIDAGNGKIPPINWHKSLIDNLDCSRVLGLSSGALCGNKLQDPNYQCTFDSCPAGEQEYECTGPNPLTGTMGTWCCVPKAASYGGSDDTGSDTGGTGTDSGSDAGNSDNGGNDEPPPLPPE